MTERGALELYRSLPYRREVEAVEDDEGRYFVCMYPELPGLSADGDTRAEAVYNAEHAFDDYIRVRFQRDDLPAHPPGSERVLRALSAQHSQAVRVTATIKRAQPRPELTKEVDKEEIARTSDEPAISESLEPVPA